MCVESSNLIISAAIEYVKEMPRWVDFTRPKAIKEIGDVLEAGIDYWIANEIDTEHVEGLITEPINVEITSQTEAVDSELNTIMGTESTSILEETKDILESETVEDSNEEKSSESEKDTVLEEVI